MDLPKNVGNNLQHKINIIIKLIEVLAEYTIQNEFDQLLFKYKHGNDIHKQKKQQNK